MFFRNVVIFLSRRLKMEQLNCLPIYQNKIIEVLNSNFYQ